VLFGWVASYALTEHSAFWTLGATYVTMQHHQSGFGGLVVSMLASGTRVHGFKPSRSRRIFSSEKILCKPFAPCRRFAACKKSPVIYVGVRITGKIDRLFLTWFCSVAWRGVPLEMADGTKGGAQRARRLRPRCLRVVDRETATHIYLSIYLSVCLSIYLSITSQKTWMFSICSDWLIQHICVRYVLCWGWSLL
jgi:hypothetical protein